jgi:NADPH:quinone reductase-like Zn-dependent oxidoreductase
VSGSLLAMTTATLGRSNSMSIPALQKQYQLRRIDKGFKLSLAEAPVAPPKDHQILIRMRAASLNRRDISITRGMYTTAQVEQLVPLSDGAGEVVAIGGQVRRFKIGDRVTPTFFQDWDSGRSSPRSGPSALGGGIDGVLSEYVTLHENGAVRIPGYLSFEQAATLPCAAVTAWSALFTHGRLKAGDSVLVQGTGGVSIFGLQLARAADAQVIITSSSDAKLARARMLGAATGINYRTTPDWEKPVLAATANVGAHHVLEVGGAGTLPKSLASLAYGGNLALIGGLTSFGGDIPTFALIGRNASATGITVGSRTEFDEMLVFMTQHRIEPVIDRTFEFFNAEAAYEYMDTGSHFGKIVIKI